MNAPLQGSRRAPFRIGDMRVEPKRNVIAGPGGETGIEPKVMDVLCVLAERAGQVLSRTELINHVWGVEYGADESLTRAVSQLRKALGDGVIETIPKRGYRLVAPVVFEDETAPPPAEAPRPNVFRVRPGFKLWAAGGAIILAILIGAVWLFMRAPQETASAPPPPTVRQGADGISVSIQPFRALDRDSSATAQALTDDITAALSRVKLLRVTSDSRSGQRTKLRYTVEGTVQRSGTSVLVNMQIADPDSGVRLWSQDYQRAFDGSIGARNSLSTTIASELYPQVVLAAQAALKWRSVFKLAPWELVLLATWVPGGTQVFLAPHERNRDWLQRRALALDPKYAPAHSSLAQFLAYTALFNPEWDGKKLHEDIASHAGLALAYAPFDADVLFQVATYQRLEGDRAQAVANLKRVLAILPSHQIARIDLPFIESQCRTDETQGIRALRAIGNELSGPDAARSVVLAHLADLHLARGSYAEAREAAGQSRHIVPTTWAGITYAAASAELGRRDDALHAVRDVRREWPNLDFDVFADRVVPRWCLHGPRTNAVRDIFHRLARLEKTK